MAETQSSLDIARKQADKDRYKGILDDLKRALELYYEIQTKLKNDGPKEKPSILTKSEI